MNKKNSKFKKFFFNKKLKNSIIVITSLIAVLYLVVLALINTMKEDSLAYQVCLVGKDALVVLFSIISTTLLTTWFVEVDSRNKIYGDIICNDFLSSEEFYNTLKAEHRDAILSNLESQKYFNGNPVKEKMYKSITDKLMTLNFDYYYTECRYSVNCDMNHGMVSNTIKKTVKMKSYEESLIINDFRLISSTYLHKDGVKAIELIELKINGKSISVDEKDNQVRSEIKKDIKEQFKSCGYDTAASYYCVDPIELNNMTECVVEMKYRSTVSDDDKMFSFRTRKPCKNFSLQFKLNNGSAQNYALSSCAFGFMDDATTSVHNSSRDVVDVNINDWIYKADGAVVVITKN